MNVIPRILVFLGVLVLAVKGDSSYNEELHLRPLMRNNLLASFKFELESLPMALSNIYEPQEYSTHHHYEQFPRSLGPILENTNTRELHLRFAQGWWDAEEWGKLPADGVYSGGTGVEVWAVIEAPNKDAAFGQWVNLANSLSGLFCASLNFIDSSITTYPVNAFHPKIADLNSIVADPTNNSLFLLRAGLPSEPICTENLTPFLKLIPTKGKAGISSLLDGHKIFDALWHGMSLDVVTECDSGSCKYKLDEAINAVIDITKTFRKQKSGIPKPIPGDELRCDTSKFYSDYQCFPLNEPKNVSWDLHDLFGRDIIGSSLLAGESSKVCSHITENWAVNAILDGEETSLTEQCFNIEEDKSYNFKFTTEDNDQIIPLEEPPLIVSRSLTGFSQDNGGFRIVLSNPSQTDAVEFVYFESLPWFIRIYLHTLKLSVNGNGTFEDILRSKFYQPAIDRKRPTHIEFDLVIPANTTVTITYNFDKSLLLYAEYPPDANHGFHIEPAVVKIFGETPYEVRTTSLLLSLPTPDFSMPYNVIILTSTVMALTFGTIFNLLTKRTVTEDEADAFSKNLPINKIIANVKQKVSIIRSKVRGVDNSGSVKSKLN